MTDRSGRLTGPFRSLVLLYCDNYTFLLGQHVVDSVPAESDSSFVESYAEIGARETFLEAGHEQAVERVRAAFTDAGFGTPTEFSPSANIREHTGEEFPPTRVIGIGSPRAGKTIAELTRGDAAVLFPCTVVVQQVEAGYQRVFHVSLPQVLAELGFAPDGEVEAAAWADAAAIAGDGVAEVFERLHGSDLAVDAPPTAADD